MDENEQNEQPRRGRPPKVAEPEAPQLYGPGPDGVPDRRTYPPKGFQARQSEPKGNQMRADE